MSTAPIAQGPVDVDVRPSAWAVRQRNPDESTDPWSDIFGNPDTAREEAAALESTSTERFDVVPMFTFVPPVITGTTEEILRDEASGYDPKGLCYVRAGLLLEAANLIAALATERDRFFEELAKVGAGRTAMKLCDVQPVAQRETARNVFAFPATTTMTPEQALRSALEFATNDNLQDVLVVGYDGDGALLVRSSRMDRKEALWLSEQLRRHALGDVA